MNDKEISEHRLDIMLKISKIADERLKLLGEVKEILDTLYYTGLWCELTNEEEKIYKRLDKELE